MFDYYCCSSYNVSVPGDVKICPPEERRHITNTDIAALTADPELGAREFTVRRSRVIISEHGTVIIPETTVVTGVIQPASQPRVSVSPDETQAEKVITVYTAFGLSAGTNDGGTVIAADELIIPGDGVYRVTAVDDWGHYGVCRAEARRPAELPPPVESAARENEA